VRSAPAPQLGDAELVRRALTRGDTAFRAIMVRYNRRLDRIARGILRNDSEAEHVVQKAYVNPFTHLGAFRGDSSLATSLARITMNEALGRLRRERAAVDLETFGVKRIEAQIPSNGDIRRSGTNNGATGNSAAWRASDRQSPRNISDGIHDAGDRGNEHRAANLLGLQRDTVKTRLHRARRLVRDELDKQIGPVPMDAFPFAGTRCERMTNAVLQRLTIFE
jgi:RNA polymerase sigma-70 factor, ECF subfamily